MSIWSRLLERAHRLFATDTDIVSKSSTAEPVMMQGGQCGPDPDDVGFTAAIVGLSAKMAKADGLVTEDEVETFSRVFRTTPEDWPSVQRVFNLARQTVRGYESYAIQISKRYHNCPCLLEGVLDGLFQIALADGVVTLDELEYLRTVSDRFGFSEADFRRIKASHMGASPDDPYAVLGVQHNAPYDEIRVAYRQLMKENHPDRMVAERNAPLLYEPVAHEKAAAITSAFAKIRAERGMLVQPD